MIILFFSLRLVFLNGESCQDWAKRLIQLLSVPRRAEDVFSLALYAWARDSEENLSSQQASVPWWRRAHQDTPVYGEELFRSEVSPVNINILNRAQFAITHTQSI